MIPPVMRAPSNSTRKPRILGGAISDCQTGILEVFMPFPKPVTMRPMMSWAMVVEAAWMAVPMSIQTVPIKTDFLRPNLSPQAMIKNDPSRQPTS